MNGLQVFGSLGFIWLLVFSHRAVAFLADVVFRTRTILGNYSVEAELPKGVPIVHFLVGKKQQNAGLAPSLRISPKRAGVHAL